MKFDLCSDIHLDFYPELSGEVIEDWKAGSEILLIAGDTFNNLGFYTQHLAALGHLRDKYREVILIMGNHDYYGNDLVEGLRRFREFGRRLNIHCLENETVEIDGQLFAGTTLWYPHPPGQDAMFSDFRYIKHFKYRCLDKHLDARDFLKRVPPGAIVVSHHLPSYECIHRKYRGAGNNNFYVGSVDDLFPDLQAKIWCFGHTHEKLDLQIGETHFLCHPRGYPFEGGDIYQPLTVDTEEVPEEGE